MISYKFCQKTIVVTPCTETYCMRMVNHSGKCSPKHDSDKQVEEQWLEEAIEVEENKIVGK